MPVRARVRWRCLGGRGGDVARTHIPMYRQCRVLPSYPCLDIPMPCFIFVACSFFLYEGPLTYSCERDFSFVLRFACAVYRYFGYLLFFPDYKTRVDRVLFSRCPDWGWGVGGCSRLENYSLPTHAERAFRYFCLL